MSKANRLQALSVQTLIHYWGGLNIPEGDQIFKAMSEILGLVGPNISTTTEIFGPGGQNIMGDQISRDRTTPHVA